MKLQDIKDSLSELELINLYVQNHPDFLVLYRKLVDGDVSDKLLEDVELTVLSIINSIEDDLEYDIYPSDIGCFERFKMMRRTKQILKNGMDKGKTI